MKKYALSYYDFINIKTNWNKNVFLQHNILLKKIKRYNNDNLLVLK